MLRRTGFKQKVTVPMKRTRLRVAGVSTTAELKKEIQYLLREICILRDKKCVLHGIKCRHEYGDEGIVFQAEHLIERSNSETFADPRLVVLVCRNCHYWKHIKKSNHDQYDAWVKSRLSSERLELWNRCIANRFNSYKMGASDWKMEICNLKSELKELQKSA